MFWFNTVLAILVLGMAFLTLFRLGKTFWIIHRSYHLWCVPSCSRSVDAEVQHTTRALRRRNIFEKIIELFDERHPLLQAELSIIGLGIVTLVLTKG